MTVPQFITAQGVIELFPLVEEIVSLAPVLRGWNIVPLKLPMGFDFGFRYEGIGMISTEIWFEPLSSRDEPQILGLRVAVPGFTGELQQQYENGVLIALDTALGERSAAEGVELVEVCALPDLPKEEGFLELPELANYIDWRKQNVRSSN